MTFAGSTAAELADSAEAAIRRGALRPGDRLPSVRRLAAELGVSPTTAAAAIRRLRERGLVVARERSGVVVSRRPPVRLAPALPAADAPALRDLATGNPDPALLPALDDALAALPRAPRLYGDVPVLPALAEHAGAAFAADGIAAGDVLVCAGALDAVERVLAAHLRPGDLVAVEDPGYHALLDLLRGMGLTPAGVPVDARGMLPGPLADTLDAGVAAVVLTPRGQNPASSALDAERAGELRSVLERDPAALVVEDDHLGALAGTPAHTLTAGRARWAVTRSVSKALGPDLRVALVTGDEQTTGRVEGRQALGTGWVSGVLQHLAAHLLEHAAADVERATAVYAERRDALVAALAARGIAAWGRSGLNVWVPVDDETAMVAGLLGAGYAVQPGAVSRLDSPPGVRITTSALPAAEAPAVADAIAAAAGRRRVRVA